MQGPALPLLPAGGHRPDARGQDAPAGVPGGHLADAIGLLSVTGMRQGEACRLRRDDVDLDAGAVTIEDSKFGKSRMVFLHPTAVAALRAYDRARDEAFPGPPADMFFLNSRGRPLNRLNTSYTFNEVVAAAGIKAPSGQRAPRLHDLRHVFTVSTLLDWYRDGGDVQARLPVLSTWLGQSAQSPRTGITPIPGLSRYLLPWLPDGPATWDDVLS